MIEDTNKDIVSRIIDLENYVGKQALPAVQILPDSATTSDIINKINELILLINKRLR